MVWGTLQSFLKSLSPMGPALGQEEVRVLWMRSMDRVSFRHWARMRRLMRDCHSPHAHTPTFPSPRDPLAPVLPSSQPLPVTETPYLCFIVSFEVSAFHPLPLTCPTWSF